MPEVAEPPPSAPADESAALKASFNAEMAKQTGEQPQSEATATQPVQEPPKEKEQPKPDAATESIIPKQFLGKQEEKKEDAAKDEFDVLTAEERGQLTAKLGGKAQESFSRLEAAAKAKIQALNAELATLRQKAESAPKGPSKEQEDQYKAAVERAAKAEEELERSAYERSPKFQKFGSEISFEIAAAKGALEGTEINPVVIDAAAQQKPADRLKTLRAAGLDAETIAAVMPNLTRADAIRRDRDASLENWKTAMESEHAEEQARQSRAEQERAAQEKAVLDEVRAGLKDNPAFTKVDGHEKWNTMVEQNLKDAEDFALGRKPLKELFQLGYDGVTMRTYKLMLDEATKVNGQLHDEVQRLRAAQPGAVKAADPSNPDATKPKNETEEYKRNFNAQMSKVREGVGV